MSDLWKPNSDLNPNQENDPSVPQSHLPSNEQQKHIESLLALHKIALKMHGQFDLQTLLQEITQQASSLIGTDSGGLFLYDEARNDLEMAVSYNGDQDYRGIRMALGEGLVGRVAQTQQPLCIADYDTWEGHVSVWKGVVKSVAAVPLIWQEHLIGVMTTSELSRKRSFSTLEMSLLQLFADQAASAIQKMKLLRSLEDSELRYRSIVESTLISVFMIQDEKIIYVNEHACKLSGFSRAEIIGKNATDFAASENTPEMRARLKKMRTHSKNAIHRATATFKHKEGHILEIEFHSQWVMLEGKPTLIGTAVDMTAQRNIERLRQRLTQIGRKILAMRELKQILKDVTEAIVAHTPFKIAGISVYDRAVLASETSGYRIADFYCEGITSEQEALGRKQIGCDTFVPHHKIIQQGLRIGQDSYYITPRQVPEIAQGIATVFSDSSEWGPHDTLYILLRHEAEIRGRISLADPLHGRMPTALELEPLESLANLAAIAIDKAQQWAQLDKALERVRLVNRTIKAINESHTIEAMLVAVITLAKELIPKIQGGSFLIPNKGKDSFEFRAAVNRDIARLRQIRLPYAETVHLLKLGKGPQILTHTMQMRNTDWRELSQSVGDPPASTLTLPIVHQKEIIGMLNLNNFDSEDAFTHNDIETVAALLPEVEIALTRAQDREELREQALRDPLTGVYNRRYLSELIQQDLKKAQRTAEPFAFLMLDFDKFFLINDKFGHAEGDAFLKNFAAFLRSNMRTSDSIIRYGGDEFVVILLRTSKDVAESVSRRLDEACVAWLKKSRTARTLKISLSLGLAVWAPGEKKEIHSVLAEADQFMYRRKRSKQKTIQPKLEASKKNKTPHSSKSKRRKPKR